MTTATINIGHFSRAPKHIIRANISNAAIVVWEELALHGSPQKPEVWVRQETTAQNLHMSARNLRRCLAELLECGLIKFVGWFQGRYKRYKLAWSNVFDQKGPTTEEIIDLPPQTTLTDRVRQACSPISEHSKQITKQNTFEEILLKHESEWQTKFPSLDGKSGRPTLRECVERAWCHAARKKYSNPKPYLEGWLRNACLPWAKRYEQEQRGLKGLKKEITHRQSEVYGPTPMTALPPPEIDVSMELWKKYDELMKDKKPGYALKMLELSSQEERKKHQPLS